MSNQSLLQLLGRLERTRCLVVGDVMLDRFVYGGIGRISPEAPIPVLAVERELDMPGGAANVARNLVSIGARAVLIGVVGDDSAAEMLVSRLSQHPEMRSQLVGDPSRPTTVKTRFVAEGQQMLRADHESSKALSDDVREQLLSAYRSALTEIDVVILSDYGKGVLCDAVVAEAIASARSAGKPVITDPKSRTFAKYRGATVLTPNRGELQTACGFECGTDEAVVEGARKILAEGICETMVVTRGKDGMSIIQAAGGVDHLRTAAREVFDVSGAGDTVIATMSAAVAAGAAIVDACSLANIAAGIVVGKRGTAVATAGEIMASLRPHDASVDAYKLFSRDSVASLASEWRKQGLRVAFTNGCFDLLHPGHISLIDQARREADRLIVGINSDQSVQRLKGPERPVQSEIARATVLASLKSVDAVVIFDEDTPLQLIDLLEPDVLVKGGDYTVETVVGADLVVKRGGRVFLANLVAGHSTTNTLKKISTPRRAVTATES
jgi:D-beta-D-heptose 7-phosphate kinase/D-beta-D-heptose 1-phosphate adenosyltransferase